MSELNSSVIKDEIKDENLFYGKVSKNYCINFLFNFYSTSLWHEVLIALPDAFVK